jgi:hypothetical protein
MIPLRDWIIPLAVLLLIIAMGRARADGLPPGVTCNDVRAAVASVAKQTGKRTTEAALVVEAIALSGGATRQQVEAAHRCLTRD